MKLLTTLLLAALAALTVYAARRRIVFALKTGALVYLVLLPIRLAFAAGSLADRLEDLVWPVFGLLLVWAVLWLVSTAYEQRRRAPRTAPTGTPCGPRGPHGNPPRGDPGGRRAR